MNQQNVVLIVFLVLSLSFLPWQYPVGENQPAAPNGRSGLPIWLSPDHGKGQGGRNFLGEGRAWLKDGDGLKLTFNLV